MINRFTTFIKENSLFSPRDKVLLAVSGGVDSMVMLHLFEKAGFYFSVIHCNFQLRGADSDADEALVRQRAEELGCTVFVRRFETTEYARMKGISIEMAARELRYQWFEEVRQKQGFSWIATAHHQDDLLETFFINLSRKTGIRGLTGIREKSGAVIRPMLFTNRTEIETCARQNALEFREDATNNELIFQRNFIRHRILPGFDELNPSFRANLAETIRNLRRVEEVYQATVEKQISRISSAAGENTEISVAALLRLPFPKQILFELLSRYGFNAAVISLVFDNLETEAGKQYFSKTHRVVTDRGKLIVTRRPEEEEAVFYIDQDDLEIFEPLNLSLEWVESENFRLVRDPGVACLDAARLEFPLSIRRWKSGEYFQPLGMEGFKKLSDFFIDEKLSLPEKENTWIVYSGDKIVWIVGRRLDNRFKVTPSTRKVLMISVKNG